MNTPTSYNVTFQFRDFENQILYFNGMYKLPISELPSASAVAADYLQKWKAKNPTLAEVPSPEDLVLQRLADFRSILFKEINEVVDIMDWLKTKRKIIEDKDGNELVTVYTEMDFLTDMADWLGDIQVYCASEMAKYGIPLKDTLKVIMSSNFSKLDSKGEPFYDDEGKVCKGPFYWKPEPQLKVMLETILRDSPVTVSKTFK